MISRNRRISVLLTLLLGVSSFLFTSGCGSGGGTEGSGLRTLEGTAVNVSSGQPEAGVAVTIESTGETAVSDDEGKFELVTEISDQPITLLFEKGSALSARATISEVSPADPVLKLDVAVDTQRNQVAVQVTAATPTPRPTATPTSPGGSGDLPTPTPTASPIPTNTAAPSATVTPTATPYTPARCDCQLDGDQLGVITANDFQTAMNLYASGAFDFNHDGATTAADLNLYASFCDPYTGTTCP
jgi:hypothetical protein